METEEAKIGPPVNPLTVKINTAILGYYFDWFAKKYLPAFKPVITSSYRTAEKNESVGGAQNSAHLHGLAYDFVLEYQNGQPVPKAQARVLFDEFVKPNWHGFALWEETPAGVWHIHVNLSRKITEYAGAAAVAALGVVAFKVFQNISNISNGGSSK